MNNNISIFGIIGTTLIASLAILFWDGDSDSDVHVKENPASVSERTAPSSHEEQDEALMVSGSSAADNGANNGINADDANQSSSPSALNTHENGVQPAKMPAPKGLFTDGVSAPVIVVPKENQAAQQTQALTEMQDAITQQQIKLNASIKKAQQDTEQAMAEKLKAMEAQVQEKMGAQTDYQKRLMRQYMEKWQQQNKAQQYQQQIQQHSEQSTEQTNAPNKEHSKPFEATPENAETATSTEQ